jgi:NADH-quinone oxidoreductase subunit L
MVMLVFYGKPRSELHAHDAQTAMRISLGALAVGACTTWLLTGRFGMLLTSTLPFHFLNVESLRGMVSATLTAPATYLALAVVALGLLIGWQREKLAWLGSLLKIPAGWARDSFGFEWINRQVRDGVRSASDGLSYTQTGQLNWNVAGILLGLVVLMLLLFLGA